MWQIILQILAIIGIILLILIGLVLLLAGLILFVPIRYKVLIDVDTLEKKYSGNARLSWLLRCLTVQGTYPEPAKLTIRVFGFPVKEIDLKREEDDETTQTEGVETQTDDTVTQTDDTVPQTDATVTQLVDETTQTEDETTCETAADAPKETSDTSKETKSEKSKTAENKAKWYEKILYTIRNLCDKIKEIWNNIEYYKDLLTEKANRQFFDRSKKRIAKLIKGIAPKRCKGQLRVGTGSPDTTGYLLAVYGMLVPYLDKEFYLEPDFEEAVCQGQVVLKGRIYLITILICIMSFVMDKQLFVLLKRLKREEQ